MYITYYGGKVILNKNEKKKNVLVDWENMRM